MAGTTRRIVFLAAVLVAPVLLTQSASIARAEVKTKAVQYKDGDTALTGHLAWDDAAAGKRPGVLVVHEWWGLNEHAKERAERLAAEGYVAFAVDMYGSGKVTTQADQARAWMTEIRSSTEAWLRRAGLGLDLPDTAESGQQRCR